MSYMYIGILVVISGDFMVSVYLVKKEKILETSAKQGLILINEAKRDISMEKLINME